MAPKTPYKNGPLEDAIVANEQWRDTPRYKSIVQMAEEFVTTPSTVYTYRYRLAKQGRIAPGKAGTRSRGMRAELNRLDLTPDGHLKGLAEEPIISALDRMRALSRVIRTSAPAMKIAAIKALEELTRVSEGRVGPPAPLTEEDRVARLSRLLMALGKPTADAAMAVAFTDESPEPEVPRPEVPLQPDAGALPPPGAASSPPLSDLSPEPPAPG